MDGWDGWMKFFCDGFCCASPCRRWLGCEELASDREFTLFAGRCAAVKGDQFLFFFFFP